MSDSDNEYDFDDFHDDEDEILSQQHKSRTTSASAAHTAATPSIDDEMDTTSTKAGGQITYGNLKDQNNTFSGGDVDSDDEYLISFPPSVKASVKHAEPLSRKIAAPLQQTTSMSQSRKPVNLEQDTTEEVEEVADEVVDTDTHYHTEANTGYSRDNHNTHHMPATVSPVQDKVVEQSQQHQQQRNPYTHQSVSDTTMDTAEDIVQDTVLDHTQLQHTGEYQEYDFEFEEDDHSLTVDDSVVAVSSPVHHTNTHTNPHGSSQDNTAVAEVEDRAHSTYYSSPTRTQQHSVVSKMVSSAEEDAVEVEDTAVPAADIHQYTHDSTHSHAAAVSHVYDNVAVSYDHSPKAGSAQTAQYVQHTQPESEFDAAKLSMLKKKSQQKRKRAIPDDEISDTIALELSDSDAVGEPAPESPSKKAYTGKQSGGHGSSSHCGSQTNNTGTAGEAIKNEFRLLGLDAMSPEMKPKLSIIHQKAAASRNAAHAGVSPVATSATPTDAVHSVRQGTQAPAAAAPVSVKQDKRGSSLASANKVMMSVYAPGHSAAVSRKAPAVPGNSAGSGGAMARNAYGKYQPAKKTANSVGPAAAPTPTEAPVNTDGSSETNPPVPNDLPAGARKVSFSNVGKWKVPVQTSTVDTPPAARTQQRVSLKPALPVRKIRLARPNGETADDGNIGGILINPADSESEYVTDSAAENSSSVAAAGANGNPAHAHRKVRLPSSVVAGGGGSAPHNTSETTGAGAGILQPKPPTKPSIPKQHPPIHSHSLAHKEKELVMPASILEENSTYSTLLDAHSTYSEDDVNYQLHQHSGEQNHRENYQDSGKGINSGNSENEGSTSTVKMHANQNSVGNGNNKKAARIADANNDVHPEPSDIQDDTSYHSYGEDSLHEHQRDHTHEHDQSDARYVYDEHSRHVTQYQHQQGGKVGFAADDHSDYTQYSTPHHHRQPDTSRSAPEHHGNQDMNNNNTRNPNHSSNPYGTNNGNQVPVPVRRRSKGAAGRGKRPGKQHFYHPQQPQRQDTEKNNPRVVKYNRGRDWMADPSHRYDESTGLFSSFETDAKREFRKEQARVNALLKRQAAEREAEAARKAYLQRRHELEVQALLREQAHLSEASNREERYEAALAQHKLAEMKTLQEREEVRAKMLLLSEIAAHSKNQYIKYASNFMGPPPPSAQTIEAQLKHNMHESPGSPKRHYVHHSPHTPPSHEKSYEQSWERSAKKSDKGEKTHYYNSGDDQSPSSGPGKSPGKIAGSRRKHTAPKNVSGDESVASYGSGGGSMSAGSAVKTAVQAPAVVQNNTQGGARYPRKGRQIVEQRANNVYGNKGKVIVSNTTATAPAVPKPAGLQPGKPLQAHPPAPRSYSDHSHHHQHGHAQGAGQPPQQQVHHHPHHHHHQLHSLDNASHSTVVDLQTGSVDSVLTDSANPSMIEYRNNSSAYFSHDSSMLQEQDGVAAEVVDGEDVLTALHRSSSTSLKGNRRSMNEILSAAASKVKVDLFGDEVDVTSIQHDIDAGLVSYHTSYPGVHDLFASTHKHDQVLDADSAYYMVQVQSMVGIDATDVKNIEIHDFYSDSPRNPHATASGSGAQTPGLTPGLTLEDAFNFAGELDLPDEGEEEVAEHVEDGGGDGGDAYSDDGWEADEYAPGSVGAEEVPEEDPEFESQQDHHEQYQSHQVVKPHRAATPKRSATAISGGEEEYDEDFDNEYADESFEQPSSRAASSAVPSAVLSAVTSAVPTYRSAMHVRDANHSDAAHKDHAHAFFAVTADDDNAANEHHRLSIADRKATPVRRTKLVSPPAPAPPSDNELDSMPATPEPAVVPVSGKRKSTPAGKRAASAVSQHSQDYGDDDFEADGDFEPYEPEDAAAAAQNGGAEEFAPLEDDLWDQAQPPAQSDIHTATSVINTQNVFDNTGALSVDPYSNTLFSQLTTTDDDNNSLDFNSSLPNSPLLGLRLGSSVDFQDSLAFSTASQSNTLSYSPEKAPTWSNTLASGAQADTGKFSYYISQNNSVYDGEEAEGVYPTDHGLPPSAYPDYLANTRDNNTGYVNNSAEDDDDLEELPATAPRTAQSDGYGGYGNDFDDFEPEGTPPKDAKMNAHATVAATKAAMDVPVVSKMVPPVFSIGCASDDSGDGDLHNFMLSKFTAPAAVEAPIVAAPDALSASEESKFPTISQSYDKPVSDSAAVHTDSNNSLEKGSEYPDDVDDVNDRADLANDGARSQELLFFNDGQDLTANPRLAADDDGYFSNPVDGRDDETNAHRTVDQFVNDWRAEKVPEPVVPAPKLAYSVRGFSMVVSDADAVDLFGRGSKSSDTSDVTSSAASKTYDAKKTDLLQRIQQQQLLEGSDSDVELEAVMQSAPQPTQSQQVEPTPTAPGAFVASKVQRAAVDKSKDALDDDLYADFEKAVTIDKNSPSKVGAKNESVPAPKETTVPSLPPLVSSALLSSLPAIKQASFRADSTSSSEPAPKLAYSVRGFSMVVTDADAVDLFGRSAKSSDTSDVTSTAASKTYDAKKTDLLQRIQQRQLLEGSDSDVEVVEVVKQPALQPAKIAAPMNLEVTREDLTPVAPVSPPHSNNANDHHDADRYENDEFDYDEVDQLDISNDTSATGIHSPSRHDKNKREKKDKKAKHSKHGKHKKSKHGVGDNRDGSVEEGRVDDGYGSEGSDVMADEPVHSGAADDIAPAYRVVGSSPLPTASEHEPAPAEPVASKAQSSLNSSVLAPLPSLAPPQTYGKLPQLGAKASTSPTIPATAATSFHPLDSAGYEDDEYDFDNTFADPAVPVTATASDSAVRGAAVTTTAVLAPAPALLQEPEPAYDEHVEYSKHGDDGTLLADTEEQEDYTPQHKNKNKSPKKDKKSKHSKHGKHKKSKNSKGDKHHKGAVEDLIMSDGEDESGFSSDDSGSASPSYQTFGAGEHAQDQNAYAGYSDTAQTRYEGYDGHESYGYAGAEEYQYQQPAEYQQQYTSSDPQYPADAYDPYVTEHVVDNGAENYEFAAEEELPAFSPSSKAQKSGKLDSKDKDSSGGGKHKKDKKDKKSKSKHKHKHKGKKHRNEGSVGSAEALDDFESDSSEDTESTVASPVPMQHRHHPQFQAAYSTAAAADHFGDEEFDF